MAHAPRAPRDHRATVNESPSHRPATQKLRYATKSLADGELSCSRVGRGAFVVIKYTSAHRDKQS